jgi:hypothetical protein
MTDSHCLSPSARATDPSAHPHLSVSDRPLLIIPFNDQHERPTPAAHSVISMSDRPPLRIPFSVSDRPPLHISVNDLFTPASSVACMRPLCQRVESESEMNLNRNTYGILWGPGNGIIEHPAMSQVARQPPTSVSGHSCCRWQFVHFIGERSRHIFKPHNLNSFSAE